MVISRLNVHNEWKISIALKSHFEVDCVINPFVACKTLLRLEDKRVLNGTWVFIIKDFCIYLFPFILITILFSFYSFVFLFCP